MSYVISNAAAKIVNNAGGTVASAIDIEGGYFPVDNLSDIPDHAKVSGAVCYCKADSKFYQYNGTDWIVINSEATSSTAGLMSATDKANLDTIVSSFNNDDADTTINTVKEVLKAFENAPEGTNVANTLANKSNKGHTHSASISSTTNANNGSAVKAVTGYNSFSGGSGGLSSDNSSSNGIEYVASVTHTAASLTGTKTFNTNAIKDVTLSASTSSSDGPTYVESVSYTAPALSGVKTFSTDAIKSVTLSNDGTTATGPKYVQEISGTAPSLTGTTTFVTEQGEFTPGNGALVAYEATATGYSSTGDQIKSDSRFPVVTNVSYTPPTVTSTATVVTNVSPDNTDEFIKAISGGSGSLEAYNAATGGTKAVSNGTRVPYVANVSHTAATLTGDTTFVKTQGTFTPGTTPVASVEFEGSSVDTGAASGTAVTALTGVKVSSSSLAAPGGHTHNYDKTTSVNLNSTATTGTDKIQYIQSISGGSGSLTNTGTTGFPYIESISSTDARAAGMAEAGSAEHTHPYAKDIYSLTSSDTAPEVGGIQYVTGISGLAPILKGTTTFVTGVTQGSGSLTVSDTETTGSIPFIQAVGNLTLGTKPSNTATFTGNPMTVVTGGATKYLSISSSIPLFKGTQTTITPTLTATKTGTCLELSILGASYIPAGGLSVMPGDAPKLEVTDTDSGSGIQVVTSLTASNKTPTGTITLNHDGTSPSLSASTIKYLVHTHSSATSAGTGKVQITGGEYSATKKYLSATATPGSGTTGTPSATTSFVTGVTGGTTSAVTKYLQHSHTPASATTKYLGATLTHTSTATSANSGTNFNAATAVSANGTASVAPYNHTHSVTAAGAINLTRGTAPSLGAATTGTVGINGGSISKTIHYLAHSHTPASSTSTGYADHGINIETASVVAEVSNGSVTTTKYGLAHSHTASALGESSKSSVSIKDGAYSATTKYMKATGTAASTGTITLSDGGITPVTKYLKKTITAASTGTVGINGGSITPTTKYLHHSHTSASLGTATTADVASQGHTHNYSTSITTGADQDET